MLKLSYLKGIRSAFQKLALDPPTQVDEFIANIEHGKDVPHDPSTDVPADRPGNIYENLSSSVLPQEGPMSQSHLMGGMLP